MSNRNDLLRQIATAIGISDDLSDDNRNIILDKIAQAYGVNVTRKTMSNLLHGIDSIINLANMPQVSRNQHLQSIAETLGSVTLSDGLSRNQYLEKWLEYAVSVVEAWVLQGGVWGDTGYWDDTETWTE